MIHKPAVAEVVSVLAVMVCSALLLTFRLGNPILWIDEVFTTNYIRHGYDFLLDFARPDERHPPGHYLTLKAWSELFGADRVGIRTMSVAWAVLCLPLLYGIVRMRFDRRMALIAIAYLAVFPGFVYYGREARMYAQLFGLLMLASFLFLVLFNRFQTLGTGKRILLTLCFAVVLAGTFYTHYISFIFYACFSIAGVALAVLRKDVPWLLYAISGIALATLLAVPQIFHMLKFVAPATDEWIPYSDLGVFYATLLGTYDAPTLAKPLLYIVYLIGFVFWRHYNIFEPTPLQMGLLLLTCLVMAYVSFRLVETPFRRGTWTNRRRTLSVSALTLGAFIVVGIGGNATHGFPGRVPEAARKIQEFRTGDTSGCHNGLEALEISMGARCVLGAEDVPPSIAFVGDSHTARITDALVEVLTPQNISFVTFNGSWCAPLLNFTTDNVHKAGCVEEVRASMDQIIHDDHIQTVVLFAEWAHYTHGFRWPDNFASVYQFSDTGDFDFSSGLISENTAHFQQALTHTLEALTEAGKTVIMVLPTPEFEFSVPLLLSALVMREAAFEDYYMSMDHYRQRSSDVREILTQAAATNSVTTVDPTEVLCDLEVCRLDDGLGNPLYEDSNHLSFYGALPLAKHIADSIQ